MHVALRTTKVVPKVWSKLYWPTYSSWQKAAGLLKHKRKALERHLRATRKEFDRGSARV